VPRPRSDISERIVDAARARFLHEGVDGASLRCIATDAGTSVGMVYYYFKTKDELFLAVIEDVYAGLLKDLIVALTPQDVAPEQRIARIFDRAARTSERELDVMCLIMREALVSSERLSRVVQRFERGHVPLVLGTLSQGVQAKRFDSSLHPAVLVASTISLAMFPHVIHRALAHAKLPLVDQRHSRGSPFDRFYAILHKDIIPQRPQRAAARLGSTGAASGRRPILARRGIGPW